MITDINRQGNRCWNETRITIIVNEFTDSERYTIISVRQQAATYDIDILNIGIRD